MPDVPVDVYSDSIGLNVATVRVSLEHLKLMAYIFRQQVRNYERQFGVQIQIPLDNLNQLRIGREDWDECWR